MGALTLTDLQPIGDEPRVRDLKLAEGLGFGQPDHVRKLIRRHEPELLTHGPLFRDKVSGNLPVGGRPQQHYLLNEPQALLVCMFARTPAAAEVRRQVVAVFLAWRRGELTAASPVQSDLLARRLGDLSARLEALERLGLRLRDGDGEAVARALTYADIWAPRCHGRRPNGFSDVEVRKHIMATHRQGSLVEIRAGMLDRFGPTRTPSRSALHRWWQRLDHWGRREGAA